MRGDFSRRTFRADKHYSGVLMQQGRVQLDADWNEQLEIARHRGETEAADVIGPSGAPKTAPGFAISVAPAGDDLRIGAGRFYVDGVLCENESEVAFTAQPDLRPTGDPLLPAADGLYLAYLEAWDRHVTALEDPSVKESALGGPDTATRTKTVWQVRLLRVTDPGAGLGCDSELPEWASLLRRNLIGIGDPGRMQARSQLEEPSPDPLCVLPPSAGYRRLENQLYRVEVHRGGTRAEATFKWSRDNGTVVSRIEPDENGAVVNGTVIRVAEMGRDAVLTFASDPLPEWLELTDDRHELLEQRGRLARVQSVDPTTREITFTAGSLIALDADHHPVVRRWDQRGAGADGVAMTGDWQALEDGVEVRFADGVYRPGDHWLVPARTAIGFETGNVEWPQDAGGPAALTADGTRHRFARLALVRRSGGAFSLVAGGDCRSAFPPLTAITAADVRFADDVCGFGNVSTVQEALDVLCQRSGSICTLLLGPGDDLAAAIERLGSAQDALICLRAGTYTLPATVRIEDRQNIQIAGAGAGTRIVAPSSEVALLFNRCASVTVSNMSVASGVAGHAGAGREQINGAITALDCGSVTVEGATVSCAGGPFRAAACVTVRNAAGAPDRTARIHACELRVGHLQTGAMLVNLDRIRVTENVISPGPRPDDSVLLGDEQYRGLLRRHLVSRVALGGSPPATTNASIVHNDRVVHFRTDATLVRSRFQNDWQTALSALNPTITSQDALARWLNRFASEMLRSRGTGPGSSPALRAVVTSVLAQDTAAAEQGVAVGGTLAADVRIADNTLDRVVKGVHVALGSALGPVAAGVVTIVGNTIRVALPTSAGRSRYAAFVGTANSVVIERNYVGIQRAARMAALRVEGMRLWGQMGRRVVVRHNHVTAPVTVGITFAPLNEPLPAQPMWIITENVMESAPFKVDVPLKHPGGAGVPNPDAVRQRIRGFADNFA